MVSDSFWTAFFGSLSDVITWLQTHDAVSWHNGDDYYHITWFMLDISFLLITLTVRLFFWWQDAYVVEDDD